MPKILPPLTDAQIRQAIRDRTGARVALRDGFAPGLELRLAARSARWSIVLGVGPAKTRTRFDLGPYPEVSLQEAREAARQTRVRGPLLPSDRATTLSGLLDRYEPDAPQSWPESRARIQNVFAGLLEAPVARLTVPALQRAVDGHPARSSAGAAVRYLRPVLKWARRRQMTDMDPSDLSQPRGALRKRDRVLTDDELRAVLTHLGATPFDEAVRLLLLTGCRLMEVCGSAPAEFDTAHKIWTIPGDRRKNAQHLVVPLTDDALEVVKRWHDQKWVWPISNWHRWQTRFHTLTGTSGWHRHDLRRTAATILGRAGVAPHIIEVVLGHAHPHSALNSIYNVERYLPEHREALETLARYYKKLLT